MAASSDLPAAMLKTLECNVCLRYYNLSDREPRSLRCGHSFCKVCIHHVTQQNSINCPKCRARCYPNQARKNFSVIEMLDTLCEECVIRSRSKSCGHCPKFLCQHCFDQHRDLYYADVKADLQELEGSISIADQFIYNDQQMEFERVRAESTLTAIREDVKNLQATLADFGKTLEAEVVVFHDENMTIQSKWRSELQTTILDAQMFISDFQDNLASGDNPRMDVAKLREKSSAIKNKINKIVGEVPKLTEYGYSKNEELGSASQMLGTVHKLGVKPKRSAAMNRQSGKVYDYSAVSYLFTRGAYGNSLKQFDKPVGVSASSSGDIFVADYGNDRVKIFRSDFEVRSIFGDPGVRYDEFNGPSGLCVSKANEVYISDNKNNRIQVYDLDGDFLRTFGKFGPHPNIVQTPTAIAIGPDNTVYVVDRGDSCIKVFRSDGTFLRCIAGEDSGCKPYRVSVTLDNKILATGQHNNSKCYVFNKNGVQLQQPFPQDRSVKYSHLAVDKFGYILLFNNLDKRVEVFKAPDQFVCDFSIQVAEEPCHIAVDHNGHIIVTDFKGHKIRVFSVPLGDA